MIYCRPYNEFIAGHATQFGIDFEVYSCTNFKADLLLENSLHPIHTHPHIFRKRQDEIFKVVQH
jgi:hypothetical protein